jgi:Fe2+ or Zn2+ uptake regulation protein
MYRTLHFWEKAGTIRQWQFLGPVFDGEELRIQSDPLPC